MAEQADNETTANDDALLNSIVEGEFVGREDDGYAFTLVDGGSEGDGQRAIVDAGEFEGEAPWEPGERMNLLVDQRTNGVWSASARKVEKLEMWDWLKEAQENDEVIEGTIIKENKGGLSVDIGLRAFLPRSHVELHKVDDTSRYVGTKADFTILKFDKQRCNIVVSRRKVLEKEREQRRQEVIDSLEEGQVLEGVVRNIQPYGAFVDVGGIDGLLHISNISWERIDHPKQVLDSGDTVEVKVLEWKPDEERLSLGRKQLLNDPWEEFVDQYDEGDVIEGEITSLADFGAFVEVVPGLEGLVHVTELSWTDQAGHPGKYVDVGEEVEVKIIDIDPEKRRVGLSVKQLQDNPWTVFAEEVESGDVIEGEITNITDFGMFVRVADDIEGLVHVSDLSWTEEISDINEHYEVGEEVEVKVLEVDVGAQRLGLGIKQLSEDPWEEAERIAKPGEKIDVEISKLTEFGAFAEVVDGVEGLIHISELADRRIDHPREVVRPGTKKEALVLDFDRKRERISLSLTKDQLEEEASEYVEEEDAAMTFGDAFGDKLQAAVDDEEEQDEE